MISYRLTVVYVYSTMNSQLSNKTYYSQTKYTLGDEQCTETERIILNDNQLFTFLKNTCRYDPFDGDTTSQETNAHGTWSIENDTVILDGEINKTHVDYKHCMDEDGTEKKTTQPFHTVYTFDQLQQMQITPI